MELYHGHEQSFYYTFSISNLHGRTVFSRPMTQQKLKLSLQKQHLPQLSFGHEA